MKSTPGDKRLSVPTTMTCRIEVSEVLGKGQEAGTTLSPHKLEEVLPVMKVKINGIDRIALVDSGCSSSVVSWMLCEPEVWKSTTILTAGRKCLLSHGVGSITLTVTNRNPLKTNVLVVNCKPLGFDLLLGMDVVKKLGGMHIDEEGKAHFAEAVHTLDATIELLCKVRPMHQSLDSIMEVVRWSATRKVIQQSTGVHHPCKSSCRIR